MVTFSVALLIILIGVGLCVSSVLGDEQQNQNTTENGGGLKHLFGLDAIRENQNALAEKMSGIEAKLEKQIEKEIRDNHKEPSPMKNNSTLALFHFPIPIYRWNASDCHPGFVINESTNAIQRNATGTEEFFLGDINGLPYPRSCRAEPIQMPSVAAGRIGIIYAEYRILTGKGPISIGLSTKEMPLSFIVGFGRVSYGYATFGEIRKNANGNEVIISDNVPSFRTGDVVGCGLNWATRQVFFTKNGQRLNITNLYVDEDTANFYPTVTLADQGDAVEANFGPNFKYDLSTEFYILEMN